jgi:murein DD-endopeptidase MepM/ murein hydrolase activator NlpD
MIRFQRIAATVLLPLWLAACAGKPAPVYYQDGSTRPRKTAAYIGNNLEVRPRSTYQVVGNETIYDIARLKRLSPESIIAANRLRPPYDLHPGQTLTLPAQRLYTVLKGETLYGIARDLNVGASALVKANRLQPPYMIYAGQQLLIPGKGTPRTQVASRDTGTLRSTNGGVAVQPLDPVATSATRPVVTAPSRLPQPAPLAGGGRFLWPAEGRVIAGFGPQAKGQHNDGIKISVAEGTPVRATENGVVAYAGDALRGYGNLLLLKHSGGWVSAYAHNSQLLVRRGDRVQRGQVIAKSGQTGNVTSPQLHFELRRGRKAVDPLQYLQNRRVSQL